jgi:ABC-type nitrate/sulfonate/bicarbonate transport system substrate-binding protein
VFGLNARFVAENPKTTLGLMKALIRAAMWLEPTTTPNG